MLLCVCFGNITIFRHSLVVYKAMSVRHYCLHFSVFLSLLMVVWLRLLFLVRSGCRLFGPFLSQFLTELHLWCDILFRISNIYIAAICSALRTYSTNMQQQQKTKKNAHTQNCGKTKFEQKAKQSARVRARAHQPRLQFGVHDVHYFHIIAPCARQCYECIPPRLWIWAVFRAVFCVCSRPHEC